MPNARWRDLMPVLVSVILPTFNRARFLGDALRSIREQTYPHWELVVIDDGSTDGTEAVVRQHVAEWTEPVRYVRQENRGAYGARNTGLDHASGDCVAFFDSDDLWLPHHLERCVQALQDAPAVDWVYAACRMVDESGTTVAPTTFAIEGRPRPFLSLHTRQQGDLHVIDDVRVLECQLQHGLYAGLQNSVIRRRVFDGKRFEESYRVVEDVLFLCRALASGLSIGYLKDVHVVYRVHGDNSSASAAGASPGRLLPIFQEQVRGLESIRADPRLPASARAILEHELASMYFWRLGYSGHWALGQRREALQAFRSGLRLRPRDWRMWKTFLACALRPARPRPA